jgi:hypothetical protein
MEDLIPSVMQLVIYHPHVRSDQFQYPRHPLQPVFHLAFSSICPWHPPPHACNPGGSEHISQ